jgi:hypothetical protein
LAGGGPNGSCLEYGILGLVASVLMTSCGRDGLEQQSTAPGDDKEALERLYDQAEAANDAADA